MTQGRPPGEQEKTAAMAATTSATVPFTPLSPRIERFRAASRVRGAAPPPSPKMRHFMHAFFELHAARPHWERYARSLAYALENEPVYLFEDELLVGMLYQGREDRPENSSCREQWKPFSHAEHVAARAVDVDPYVGLGYAPGHVGWRWDRVLELGVEGLMAELRRRLEAPRDERAAQLYQGALIL